MIPGNAIIPHNYVLIDIDEEYRVIDGTYVYDAENFARYAPISGTIVLAPERLVCYDVRNDGTWADNFYGRRTETSMLRGRSDKNCFVGPGMRVMFRYTAWMNAEDDGLETEWGTLVKYDDIVALQLGDGSWWPLNDYCLVEGGVSEEVINGVWVGSEESARIGRCVAGKYVKKDVIFIRGVKTEYKDFTVASSGRATYRVEDENIVAYKTINNGRE